MWLKPQCQILKCRSSLGTVKSYLRNSTAFYWKAWSTTFCALNHNSKSIYNFVTFTQKQNGSWVSSPPSCFALGSGTSVGSVQVPWGLLIIRLPLRSRSAVRQPCLFWASYKGFSFHNKPLYSLTTILQLYSEKMVCLSCFLQPTALCVSSQAPDVHRVFVDNVPIVALPFSHLQRLSVINWKLEGLHIIFPDPSKYNFLALEITFSIRRENQSVFCLVLVLLSAHIFLWELYSVSSREKKEWKSAVESAKCLSSTGINSQQCKLTNKRAMQNVRDWDGVLMSCFGVKASMCMMVYVSMHFQKFQPKLSTAPGSMLLVCKTISSELLANQTHQTFKPTKTKRSSTLQTQRL